MTLQELYKNIDGDYDQAIRILRVEKKKKKHIIKLTKSGVVDSLIDAGKDMDPVSLFERAHAVKGVCANLGLVKIADAASEISEEFRPGRSRNMTDEEVKEKIDSIKDIYTHTAEEIREFEKSGN